MPENLVSRDGFSRPVPRQPARLHTQAESAAYLRDSSRVPRRRPIMKPPYAIGSVPSLSGHANAYRWCSLPRVRRHRASKPQGSSERVLPWQVITDQLIFASLSHTNYYWYKVGMLKVPQLSSCTFFFFNIEFKAFYLVGVLFICWCCGEVSTAWFAHVVTEQSSDRGGEEMVEIYLPLHGGCNQKGPFGGWDRISR